VTAEEFNSDRASRLRQEKFTSGGDGPLPRGFANHVGKISRRRPAPRGFVTVGVGVASKSTKALDEAMKEASLARLATRVLDDRCCEIDEGPRPRRQLIGGRIKDRYWRRLAFKMREEANQPSVGQQGAGHEFESLSDT
jgi:hypothetical protein